MPDESVKRHKLSSRNPVNWFLIGLFIRSASQLSFKQLLVREELQGVPVRKFMSKHPITVDPAISIKEFVEDYVYKYHHKLYPVAKNSKLEGCVDIRQVKEIDRDRWDTTPLKNIVSPCSGDNSIQPDTDVMKALKTMQQNGISHLLITSNGKLEGIITLKDIFGYLSVKLDLEGEDMGGGPQQLITQNS